MSTPSKQKTEDPADGLMVYQVGGSVRDELLGLPVTDRDHVVVGSDPEAMLQRGFRPVGKDFPVFLHPHTHEEYALARTERKTAPGYHGFTFNASPEVTLEEDLARRDLTINAMAIDATGQLVDPFNGRLDLAQGRLRHVAEAFVEDPVRVLRLARFATRFDTFEIAESTLALCQSMAASGELDALVTERVWVEFSRALMYAMPSRMVLALQQMHALVKVWPELDQTANTEAYRHALNALDAAADQQAPLEVRFALLARAMDLEAIGQSTKRLKVPNRCEYWAHWAGQRLGALWGIRRQNPEEVLAFVQSLDAIRQPDRLDNVAALAQAWVEARAVSDKADPDVHFLQSVLAEISRIDGQAFAQQGLSGPQIGEAIRQARLDCIERCQRSAR